MKKLINSFLCLTVMASCSACSSDKEQLPDGPGGYLFAHMTNANYGAFYYSVSEDGITWRTLNGGARINEYRGHPDFCLGHDGRYYMIGVEAGTGQALLWETSNLIGWGIERRLPKSAFDLTALGHTTETLWYGAPKMYWDAPSGKYIITWHAAAAGLSDSGTETQKRNYWRSIRTFYILTSDFVTFTAPARLFNFTGVDENMPTMDAIIRKVGERYHSFIKDERWPEDVASGYKAVHQTSSANLTGPWENPSAAITETWHEAQTVVPTPDGAGWRLYCEYYPNYYEMWQSASITGPWLKTPISPPDARHGSMIWVDGPRYQAILRAYK